MSAFGGKADMLRHELFVHCAAIEAEPSMGGSVGTQNYDDVSGNGLSFDGLA
jgi:hypothetical protein